MDYKITTFPNGIRFLHIPATGPVAHLAVYINAGTRDEADDQNGMAHFIEHTIFKGTTKRKAFHVLTRLESVGGELNAFTTKEETCIFATFLVEHFHRALELVSDILTHPTFPEKELKKEKDVILDEINSYKDNPSEEIYDLFEENIFKDHDLSKNILGKPEHIQQFAREDAIRFIHEHYTSGRLLVCTSGNLNFRKISHLAEKYFESVKNDDSNPHRKSFLSYQPFTVEMAKAIFQTHCMMGNLAYDRKDPRRLPLFLLNNILGGPAMNSRLNMAVRERHGYAYTVESAFLPYTDTGIFSIYLGTDSENLDKSLNLIRKEMDKLRMEKLSSLQLNQSKKQLVGQLEIANESNLNFMMSAGKAYLHDNRIEEPGEIRKKIENISAEQIIEVARDVFDPGKMSMLVFNSNNQSKNND